MNNKFHSILISFSISPRLTGFLYLEECLQMISENSGYLYNLKSGLYTELAITHNTSISNIERNIRTAIENGRYESVSDSIDPNKGKPTNLQFLWLIKDMLDERKAS